MSNSIKEDVIEFIKRLPDDVSMEDIMYHFYIKETIEQRKREIEEGKVELLSNKEVQDEFQKWLK